MFTWPLDDYIITRDFYYLASLYVGGQHAALDLIRRTGTTRAAPIRAIAEGIVVGVGWDMYSGFFVAVSHTGNWRSFYRHLYGQTPVAVGQQVSQGQIIGNVGNTGWSQGDHLHFDLWCTVKKDSTAFYKNSWWAHNPVLYLGQEEDDMTKEYVKHSDGTIYVLDGPYKKHISAKWYNALRALGYTGKALSDKHIDAIPERPVGSGQGATANQVVDRFKARL